MSFSNHHFSNFCNSLKSIKLASLLKGSTSKPRSSRNGNAGTRSGTITCVRDTKTASTSQASPIPSPRGSKRRIFKRRKGNEKVAEIMTNAVSPSHSTLNDDAPHGVPKPIQSSQIVTQDVSSIPAQSVNDDRSPESASCVPDEQVWHTSQPANVDLDALDQAFLHRSSETEPLHDMLCNIQSTVVASDEDDESKGFAERDNDVLREYFSIRTNIVLCSSYPEVAPHIVISPAIDTPEDFYTPWMNRVNYYGQEPNRLPVPGFDPCRLARMPYRDEQCYWPVTMGYQISMACGNPRRVFSRSRFDQLTVETGSERLTMYHVVTALQRHRFKAVAFETCEHAKIWSDRYNDASVLESLENPFVWTDPAEPLLKSANFPGVAIIDSPSPFSVPHIMIWSPPPQDPWIHYSTATNDPQDGGFGQFLVVPSRSVSFINMSPTQYPTFDSILDYDDRDDGCSDTFSEPDTPEPRTPIDLEDEQRYLPWEHSARYDDDEDENDHYGSWDNSDTQHENLCSHSWERSESAITEEENQEIPDRPSKHIFYFDDEEEEDLPPLDDWYLSVASRNGIQISC